MATMTTARDQASPALHKAQEALTDTVLPALRDTLALAREKGTILLDSDAAAEAKRRSVAVMKAAKGDRVMVAPARRWRLGLGMLAIGGGIGYGVAYLMRRLTATAATYDTTSPAPSGTVDSTAQDVDLRAGAPTTI